MYCEMSVPNRSKIQRNGNYISYVLSVPVVYTVQANFVSFKSIYISYVLSVPVVYTVQANFVSFKSRDAPCGRPRVNPNRYK